MRVLPGGALPVAAEAVPTAGAGPDGSVAGEARAADANGGVSDGSRDAALDPASNSGGPTSVIDVSDSADVLSSGTFLVAADRKDVAEDDLDSGPRQERHARQNAQIESLQRFKDEATAMLVHDLKSPLSAMMMNLDFALADLPDRPDTLDLRSALAESRAAGAKLFRMIANLLDIARSDDGRLVPKRASLDVEALFVAVIGHHAQEAAARQVTISHEVALDRPVDADPDLLARVLGNLVERALRHAHAGGNIVLAARPRSGSGEQAFARAVDLTVSYEGRPVPPEVRARLFEKHPRALRGQSHGHALYFCRVAVEAHGGSIELASAPASSEAAGSGARASEASSTTCFRIQLPQT